MSADITELHPNSAPERGGGPPLGGGGGGASRSIDQELQPILARDGLAGLSELLTIAPPGEMISTTGIGALVALIKQAGE